jgi:hypothetical protein
MKEKNADPIRDDEKAAHPPGIARTAATTLRREGEPG